MKPVTLTWLAEHPRNLALFRISVCAVILVSPETYAGRRLADVPRALWVVPEGLGWFVQSVPISSAAATTMQAVAIAAAACGVLGLYARIALPALAIASFYLFALSQLSGTVTHDMHLVWFAALLGASPCADALALDARAPVRERALAYGVPLWGARLLFAAIYFFPGLWKLRTSGLAWALGDNLRNQMYFKWFEWDHVPALRLDHAPWLLHAGGLLVLAFEIGFPLLLLTRRTRLVAAVLGLAFHLASEAMLRIPFLSLWACYTALVDGDALLSWLRAKRGKRSLVVPLAVAGRSSALAAALGLALIAGAVVQGARGRMQGWPFACYPTFQWTVGTEIPDLLVVLESPEGKQTVVARGPRSQQAWGAAWSLSGALSGQADRARLEAHWTELAPALARAQELPVGGVARFYRAYYSVLPEDRGKPPVSTTELLALPITPTPAAPRAP